MKIKAVFAIIMLLAIGVFLGAILYEGEIAQTDMQRYKELNENVVYLIVKWGAFGLSVFSALKLVQLIKK